MTETEQVLACIRKQFAAEIEKKTLWGRQEVILSFDVAVKHCINKKEVQHDNG